MRRAWCRLSCSCRWVAMPTNSTSGTIPSAQKSRLSGAAMRAGRLPDLVGVHTVREGSCNANQLPGNGAPVHGKRPPIARQSYGLRGVGVAAATRRRFFW